MIEALADGQTQAPEGQRIGQIRVTHGAKIDGVEAFQSGEPVLGHHLTRGTVEIAAPGEFMHLQREIAGALLERAQHFKPGGDDLLADAIPGDDGDFIRAHVAFPQRLSRKRFACLA